MGVFFNQKYGILCWNQALGCVILSILRLSWPVSGFLCCLRYKAICVLPSLSPKLNLPWVQSTNPSIIRPPTLVWLPWCQCCNVFTGINGKCRGYSNVAPCSREVCTWICLRGIGYAWNFLNRSISCIISYQILEARSMHEMNSA